ncbi:MAG: glutathione S-transferase N-terminal domain-containing protein [Cyanobacteria bacterium J06592_8]
MKTSRKEHRTITSESNSPSPKVTSYAADISICSQICRLAVHEHGLDNVENVNIDIEYAMDNYEPWFVRMQPTMTVPVLKYDEQIIGDSKDIMLFLAEKHPEQGLYPTNQKSGIDQYINDFYAKFNFIGVFTFGNLATMKLSILDFEELLGIFLN